MVEGPDAGPANGFTFGTGIGPPFFRSAATTMDLRVRHAALFDSIEGENGNLLIVGRSSGRALPRTLGEPSHGIDLAELMQVIDVLGYPWLMHAFEGIDTASLFRRHRFRFN